MSRIRAVLVVCGVLAAVPVFGASPDPKDLAVPPEVHSKARELVRRLGSEIYREREDAHAELVKMGRLARPALAEGAGSDLDPEIRQRCARLLPKAAAADLQARIDTFLADTEGKFDHDLPGLKSFRKHVTGNEKTRALYVEILKNPYNLEMFTAMDRGPAEGGRAISDRRTALFNDLQHRAVVPGSKPFVPKQPTVPDLAALLFAESMVTSDHIPKAGGWTWVNGAQLLQQSSAGMQALNNASTPHAEAFKDIVGRWLVGRTDPAELSSLSYALGQTSLRQFKESNLVLRRIILTDGVQGYARGQAMNALLTNRVNEELPFLRAILRNRIRVGDYPGVLPDKKDPDTILAINDTVIQQVWFNRPNGQPDMHSCLMKDVALAYLIMHGGGKIQDYGLELQQQGSVQLNNLGYGQYAFPSEEKRTIGYMRFGWKQLKDSIDGPAPKETPKEAPKPPPSGPQPAPPPVKK